MSVAESRVNLQDAKQVASLFERAAQCNLDTAARRGSIVQLGSTGRVVITGDLHDHRDNLDRIIKLARLNRSLDHHVVFQEVIHGDRLVNGMDFSYRSLARIAELKLRHPQQVHQVLSNHEIAQVNGEGILKDGVSTVAAFSDGLEYVFDEEATAVAQAAYRFIRTMPLAVRCANGVWASHSLPAPRKLAEFDVNIIDRELSDEDFVRHSGSAYLMVWGRGLTQELADELAACWDVDQFVLGHQHAEMGFEEYGETMLVINSDHAHGMALPIELNKSYTRDELTQLLIPLAAVV